MNTFPSSRPRRLRRNANIRKLVSEHHIRTEDLIYPLFVVHGHQIKKAIPSIAGQYHYSVDMLETIVPVIRSKRILGIMLFGIPANKDAYGSESYDKDGLVQKAIMKIKTLAPELVVFTDVCLCSYTDTGHCGLMIENEVANDATLAILNRIALSHAQAGADFVAPSGMIDGMVTSIRQALDHEGYEQVGIMAYSVKYASSFYGPFRQASATSLQGDRQTYQMDSANAQEALKEVKMDIKEGADFVMVKPALPYLDIIYRIANTVHLPVAAYQVSGEYAMLHNADENNLFDAIETLVESLIGIKRAGAQVIITYAALEISDYCNG
jgi:porphobilinogen synthase